MLLFIHMKGDGLPRSTEHAEANDVAIALEKEAAERLQLLVHESTLRPIKIRDAIADAAEHVVIHEIGALCRRAKEHVGEGSYQRLIDTLIALAACAPVMTTAEWSVVRDYAQWLKAHFGPRPLKLVSPNGEPYTQMTLGDGAFTDAFKQFDEAETWFSKDGSSA